MTNSYYPPFQVGPQVSITPAPRNSLATGYVVITTPGTTLQDWVPPVFQPYVFPQVQLFLPRYIGSATVLYWRHSDCLTLRWLAHLAGTAAAPVFHLDCTAAVDFCYMTWGQSHQLVSYNDSLIICLEYITHWNLYMYKLVLNNRIRKRASSGLTNSDAVSPRSFTKSKIINCWLTTDFHVNGKVTYEITSRWN